MIEKDQNVAEGIADAGAAAGADVEGRLDRFAEQLVATAQSLAGDAGWRGP